MNILKNKKVIIVVSVVLLIAIIVVGILVAKNLTSKEVQRYGRTEVYLKDQNADVIAGAKVSFNKKDTGKVIDEEAESGLDGKIIFTNVPVGEYEIVVKEAPKGYEIDQEKADVTIEPAQTTVVNIDLKRVRASVILRSKDADGNLIPNIKYNLYNAENEVIQEITSNEEGLCGVTDLPLGNYSVQVAELPEGYQGDTSRQELKLEQEGQVLLIDEQFEKIN